MSIDDEEAFQEHMAQDERDWPGYVSESIARGEMDQLPIRKRSQREMLRFLVGYAESHMIRHDHIGSAVCAFCDARPPYRHKAECPILEARSALAENRA